MSNKLSAEERRILRLRDLRTRRTKLWASLSYLLWGLLCLTIPALSVPQIYLGGTLLIPTLSAIVAWFLYRLRVRTGKNKGYVPSDDYLPAVVIFSLAAIAAAVMLIGFSSPIGIGLAAGFIIGLPGGTIYSLPLAMTRGRQRLPNEGMKIGLAFGSVSGLLFLIPLFSWQYGLAFGISFGISCALSMGPSGALTFAAIDFAAKSKKNIEADEESKTQQTIEQLPDPRRVRLLELNEEIQSLETKRIEALRIEQELAVENPDPFRSPPVRQ